MGPFLAAMDALDPTQRRNVIANVFLFMAPAADSWEDLREAAKGDAYSNFRQNCGSVPSAPIEMVVVTGLVHLILNDLSYRGDLKSIERTKDRVFPMVEAMAREGKDIQWGINHLENLPETIEQAHQAYLCFCDEVLPKLFAQSSANPL
jgi:hypothetical protein